MVKNSIIDNYLFFGKELIPTNGKIPKIKNWRNVNFTKEDLHNHKGNIAWRLNEDDLIIDIDPRNGGDKSFEILQKKYNLNLDYTVKTPRGGYHIYLQISKEFQNFSFKKTLPDYEGIDFLKKGNYCLISGCETEHGYYIWADDLLGSFSQSEAPIEIINLIKYTPENITECEIILKENNVSKNKVEEILSKLDPSMHNDDWVKVGMALHDWDNYLGLSLWEDWSKGGKNYKIGETRKRWSSFKANHGVTLGSLFYLEKEVEYEQLDNKVNDYINRINSATKKDIDLTIISKIKKENLPRFTLEILAKTIKDRYKMLTGVNLPITEIRSMIQVNEVSVYSDTVEKPYWCKDWVYINSHGSFANTRTFKILKTEAFNILNGKYVPEGLNGGKQTASRYVADKGFVDTVDIMAYLPNTKDAIVYSDNCTMLNTFNPKSLPTEAKTYSDKGLEAISLVKKHIKFICGSEENAVIFTQWLAHQVQLPGKQILWSPVIQSIQGVGKSFFGELLRSCLGDQNVGTVSPTQVVSDFNGWATGVSVNVLEELKIKGHSRYDAVNALKPLITDRMIQINDKGVRQYMTYNTTNYICFTNYRDAIPLDQDDRRWWIIFVQVESLDEMGEIVGEPIVTYFPKLFNAVREFGNEIRKWMLEYQLSDEFLNTKQAPVTKEKLTMIATEEYSTDGFVEVRELIERGGKYYNKDVISSSDLFADMVFEYPEIEIHTSKRNLILKKLGYSACEKNIRIDGKLKKIWTKRDLSNEKIRTIFKL